MSRMLRQMPQPLKTVYSSSVAVFLIGMVVVAVLDSQDGIRLVLVPFGALMALTGLVLALDLRGNATEYSRQLREYEPAGADRSGVDRWGDRVIVSVRGVRLLGAAVCLVGLFLSAGVPLLP